MVRYGDWVDVSDMGTYHQRDNVTLPRRYGPPGKGMPTLARNEVEAVRAVGGPAAHRGAGNFGKEFRLRPDRQKMI